MIEAACRDEDPNLFFPEKNDTSSINKAVMTCFTCPVRQECKDYSNRTGSDYGIWAAEQKKRGKKDGA